MTRAPVFVLVRPQLAENIGASARAMWNFGLDRMRLVAPRDGWPDPRAVAMASGAGRLLDDAGRFEDVPAALADCEVVYATTARRRDLSQPVLTPEAAMAEARAHTAAGRQVAVMFGPERAGLENEDLVRASAIISVPVNPDFPSLNLAQCVLLTAYEWRRSGPPEAPDTGPEPASGIERERLGDHMESALDATGFFFPLEKAPRMRLNLRAMLGRLALTRADVQLLHGALRQLARGPARDAAPPAPGQGDAGP